VDVVSVRTVGIHVVEKNLDIFGTLERLAAVLDVTAAVQTRVTRSQIE
jgi:hypothetical protein